MLIKKSRFIACAKVVGIREDARAFLLSKKAEHPSARHLVGLIFWVTQRASNAVMSDDGELSGTAGKPVLSVMQHKKIKNTRQ